jgi:tight adherence protein B
VPAAHAADGDLSIGHVEPGDDNTIQVLVSVPEGASVNPDDVRVSIGDTVLDSSADLAGSTTEQVRRTTIIAFDTSDSMGTRGRIGAAKAAAKTFLDTVPDDVYVGIVTFDGSVETPLEPTQDRAEAQTVIDGLTLATRTRLNDGVIEAVNQAGTDGQRRILVLSDGRDTSTTPESKVTAAIAKAEVGVDVVALDQSGSSLAPLQAMSDAGDGQVIAADAQALTQAFTAEAAALARQILVTATLPDNVPGTEATVTVTAPIDGTTTTANTYAVIRGASDPAGPTIAAPDNSPMFEVSRTVMYAGLAAVGLGLLILMVGVLVSPGSGRMSAEDRIQAYGKAGTGVGATSAHKSDAPPAMDQAKNAAARVLHKNRGLEAKILQRLEAAGSALKPAEWLLIHGALVVVGGLGGLLLGGGNFILMALGLLVGYLLPKLWLRRMERKRLKAFNHGLADTLQLMAGSLSAGLSLAQSVDTVVREGQEPIAGEFNRVLIETRLGVPLEDALDGIAERMGSKDFGWVVMAIRIQREVGGNLAELLTNVAATLRERDYLRRQVQTMSAEGKLSGYILGGLPPAMLVYMLLVRRDYVMPLVTTPMGWGILAFGAVLLAMGAFIMSRLVKVEV